MPRPPLRRGAFRDLALGPLLLAAVLPLSACSGWSATDEQLQPTTASTPSVGGSGVIPSSPLSGTQPSSTALGADKFYDLTVNVTNQTDADLTLSSATLGHPDGEDGGHWDQRATDVPAHHSIQVSGYSAVQGQSISLVYTAVSADRAVKLTLVAQDPAIGSNNTNGTKVSGPMSVTPTITNGRDSTATFQITSYAAS